MNKELKELIFYKRIVEKKRINEIKDALQLPKSLHLTMNIISEIKEEFSERYREIERLNAIYNQKRREFLPKGQFKFDNFKQFYEWHREQGKTCYYCGSEEHKISDLVRCGKDEDRNGKENLIGIYGSQLQNRGVHLEIERKDSKANIYSPENCVLICYFCNNDKSNVFSYEDYMSFGTNFFKARKKFIDKKHAKLKEVFGNKYNI